MGLLWRRRSSVFKIVIALVALWFTIVFFTYSDDRSSSSNLFQVDNNKVQQKSNAEKLQAKQSDYKNYNDFKKFRKESFKDANIDEKNEVEDYNDKEFGENNDIVNGNEIVHAEEENKIPPKISERKPPSKKKYQNNVQGEFFVIY